MTTSAALLLIHSAKTTVVLLRRKKTDILDPVHAKMNGPIPPVRKDEQTNKRKGYQ